METFTSQWSATISNLAPRLKDKSSRAAAMQAICQLTWTYLARVNDSPTTRLRKVEEIIRIAFPSGRKSHLASDARGIRCFGSADSNYWLRLPGLVFSIDHFPTHQSRYYPIWQRIENRAHGTRTNSGRDPWLLSHDRRLGEWQCKSSAVSCLQRNPSAARGSANLTPERQTRILCRCISKSLHDEPNAIL